MNLIKGLMSVAAVGAVVAGATYLVLKKDDEEENVIYSSTKEFNKETDEPTVEAVEETKEGNTLEDTANVIVEKVKDVASKIVSTLNATQNEEDKTVDVIKEKVKDVASKISSAINPSQEEKAEEETVEEIKEEVAEETVEETKEEVVEETVEETKEEVVEETATPVEENCNCEETTEE